MFLVRLWGWGEVTTVAGRGAGVRMAPPPATRLLHGVPGAPSSVAADDEVVVTVQLRRHRRARGRCDRRKRCHRHPVSSQCLSGDHPRAGVGANGVLGSTGRGGVVAEGWSTSCWDRGRSPARALRGAQRPAVSTSDETAGGVLLRSGQQPSRPHLTARPAGSQIQRNEALRFFGLTRAMVAASAAMALRRSARA
jgi:hypothetical protein